ncbi:unnamed protein product [Ectocarpus sp. CCAP 1310/34]|nr:unnamed protein product [Ectocarpus sp. CCAP 1310/34]
MQNESNAAASFSGNRGTESTGRQPSSSSSAPVATTGESPPGKQGSGGGDADGSDDDSDDTGVHIGGVASVEAEEINRADAVSKKAFYGAGSRRPAAGVAEGRNSGRVGRAAAATTGLAGGLNAARRLGGGGVGDDGGGSGHAGGNGDSASGVHGAKRPRKKVVLASEFSDSSSDEDREIECSKSGPIMPQPSTSIPAPIETGHSTSPSPEVPRQKLPAHHQPSLFFASTTRRARQPGPNSLSGRADDSSNAAATGPTESAAPAVSSDRGDVGLSGDATDMTASSAARQEPPPAGAEAVTRVGQREPPVGWVIDVRPTPPSDIPLLPRRKKQRRKKAGGGLAAAGLAATPTGHKDTVSSAATDGDISVRDEDAHPASSAVLEPGMPTGRGGGGRGGGRSAQATSTGEEEPVEAQGAGVSDAATPRRRQASCSNTGRGSGGGEDDEECKSGATNAPGLPKDMTERPKKATSKPWSGVTNSRKPGTAVLPGTAGAAGADAGVAASAATAEAGRGALGRSVNAGRVPQKGTVHAADGSESESRGDLRMTLQMLQLTSAGNSKRSATETERQPKETDKTIGSGGGGGGQAGTKRSWSGEGREEESKSVKKPKKKKKKAGAGGSFPLSAVKRDDIDDIFGTLT